MNHAAAEMWPMFRASHSFWARDPESGDLGSSPDSATGPQGQLGGVSFLFVPASHTKKQRLVSLLPFHQTYKVNT